MENRSLASELVLFLVAALWGLAFVAQRVGTEFLGPFTYNGVRFLLGAASLIPVILLLGRSRTKRQMAKTAGRKPLNARVPLSSLVVPSILGGLILTVAANLQQIALKTISAGKAGFVTGLYVVLVPIAGAFLGRRTPVLAWLGCAAAAVGLYFLSLGEGFTISRGDTILLISTVFWTAHILFLDTFAKKVDPIKLSAGQFFICGTLTLIGAFVFEEPRIAAILRAAVPILYGGFISIGVAYTLQAVAQQKAHPARAAVIMSLESVFAAVGGALILAERLSVRETAGCAMMFVGMLIAQAPGPRKKAQSVPSA